MPLPDLPYNAILCRYNEIATKGGNRLMFENLFVQAVLRVMAPVCRPLRVVRERGRIFFRLKERSATFSPAELAEARRRLPWVAGLVSASPGFLTGPQLELIEQAVLTSFPAVYKALVETLPPSGRIPYAMRARRNYKKFPMTSKEIEIHFANLLLEQYPLLDVDLRTPQLRVGVEVRLDKAFVHYETIDGPGGLPAGSGGRVLALLSGGFDSPVACFEMMKRGCNVDYVTFHSEPYTPPALLAKVGALARILNRFQEAGRLVAVNLLPLQKAVRDICQERLRTVLYRRAMVRMATAIGRTFGAKALMTGDNIGQVASQTLENLHVVSAATDLMILRPLLTSNKVDIIRMATQIGTMEESREEVPDSCTVFAPSRPATAAALERILAEEARLDMDELLRECCRGTTILDLETLEGVSIPGLEDALG
ncbi:MAG: tRNA 4-thiouridine(8) synthase ThiI [Lentisphaeria bacterium]|nr:tRNA 4-thiouridine(8) synthase ThiI [Lentisphaeria bacterium]